MNFKCFNMKFPLPTADMLRGKFWLRDWPPACFSHFQVIPLTHWQIGLFIPLTHLQIGLFGFAVFILGAAIQNRSVQTHVSNRNFDEMSGQTFLRTCSAASSGCATGRPRSFLTFQVIYGLQGYLAHKKPHPPRTLP